jgi:signal transduction histidine kinase
LKHKAELNIDLENMMFTISHKVRKSVADIIGISKILCDDIDIELHEFKEMLGIIIQSAESLNLSTEELSKLIHDNKQN